MSKIPLINSVQPNSREIILLDAKDYPQWRSQQPALIQNQLNDFEPKEEAMQRLYNTQGEFIAVMVIGDDQDMWTLGHLAKQLPSGDYYLSDAQLSRQLALGYALGAYTFNRYKTTAVDKTLPRLAVSHEGYAEIYAMVEAIYLTRDLVNTPAEDMGPEEIAMSLKAIAEQYQAQFSEIVGEDLIKQRFESVYHVGKGSHRPPRLAMLTWGNPQHYKVSLVGKGVAFDTGGLDIKPASGMLLMHKDMGGSAHVIGLAKLLMEMKLPIYLEVFVPTVENAIGPKAYRPSDVIKMRNGTTVQINNTDAEGRVILADVLTEASSRKPDVLIDFATLTGAARVALGTEVGAYFCNDSSLAQKLFQSSESVQDPIWQLPLYHRYLKWMNSDIADLSNSSSAPFGGAITAALFLEKFVEKGTQWVHFDVMAWNTMTTAGRPKGGEAIGLRAVYDFIKSSVSH